MSNLYIFDGSNLAMRSFHAFPNLTIGGHGENGDDGFPIGAIYGVCKILQTFVKDFPPGAVLAPFDVSKSEHRLDLYPEYKGNRGGDEKKKAEMLLYYKQVGIIHEVVEKFGITTITEEARGFEADDVISYLISRFNRGDFPGVGRVVIISSDRDLCALINPKVVWFDPIRNRIVTHDKFKEQFGIELKQFPDYKTLLGDKSDNIPHIKGIGDVAVVKMLTEYGSLEGLRAAKLKKLEEHWPMLDLNRKLVALDLHEQFPDNTVWKEIDAKISRKPEFSEEKIVEMFTGLSFVSLLETWEMDKERWKAFYASNLF